MWKDEAEELLMSLRGEQSECTLMLLMSEQGECTLMLLMSEQGELRKLISEQDEQYYYIGRMNFLKRFIMFNF